ncbi:hypothetical protein ABH922_000306 [Rhodococcus sp. 27YEA15]
MTVRSGRIPEAGSLTLEGGYVTGSEVSGIGVETNPDRREWIGFDRPL